MKASVPYVKYQNTLLLVLNYYYYLFFSCLNAQDLMLQDSRCYRCFLHPRPTSTVSIYSRTSLTGNNTVIGSLNASEKPFMFSASCIANTGFTHWNRDLQQQRLLFFHHLSHNGIETRKRDLMLRNSRTWAQISNLSSVECPYVKPF